MQDVCGRHDERLTELETEFKVRMIARGSTLKIIGPSADIARAADAVAKLVASTRKTPGMNRHQMRYAVDSVKAERREDLQKVFGDKVRLPAKRRAVAPMTGTQKLYLDAIRTHDVVFGVGPAGTGKTYLAMAMAVHYLVSNLVRRIVLVRPAVEAGEKLGFLPGDIAAKFDPFVRPLYDALNDMVEPERAKLMLENNVIEVAPLAFMRGRTLNSSFVILDEAQNTSVEQMKMFLTRLGYDSKAVVTGDVTQIDLPTGKESGLVHVRKILDGVEGLKFIYFQRADVVRHELVKRIVEAYERAEEGGGTQPELPFRVEPSDPRQPADDSGAPVIPVDGVRSAGPAGAAVASTRPDEAAGAR